MVMMIVMWQRWWRMHLDSIPDFDLIPSYQRKAYEEAHILLLKICTLQWDSHIYQHTWGIMRQQSPITANLLGGPGQQWQGIPASHRWVPGERIRPRGWLQMSVNSQSCELQPPKWCGLPVHSFNLLSHWQPLTSLVPFLGSTVLYLFERQRSTQPFYTLKQATNQRGATNVMLQCDGECYATMWWRKICASWCLVWWNFWNCNVRSIMAFRGLPMA